MGGKCFSPLSRLARHGGCFSYGVFVQWPRKFGESGSRPLENSAVTTITNFIGTH